MIGGYELGVGRRIRGDQRMNGSIMPEAWDAAADAELLTGLFSPAGRQDPQSVLRSRDVPGCRHALVDAVLHDRRFVAPRLPVESPDLMFQTLMRWLPRVRGERHRDLRARFGGLFTARRVERFRAAVTARTNELIDEFASRSEFDLVSSLSRPLPFQTICDVMAIPEADRHSLGADTAELMVAFGNQRDRAAVEEGNATAQRVLDYFSDLLTARAAGGGDDLVTALADQLPADPEDRADVVANCVFFVIAGHETTSTLIAAGAGLLAEHPEQLSLLTADPSRWPAAVEELLRHVSPTTLSGAFALETAEVAGVRFEAGDQPFLFFAGANHDPARFPNPDRLDIDREATGHLAFSAGPHFCLGAPLARLETQVCLSTLFGRLPGLRPAEPQWGAAAPVRQIVSLPCRIDR